MPAKKKPTAKKKPAASKKSVWQEAGDDPCPNCGGPAVYFRHRQTGDTRTVCQNPDCRFDSSE